MNIIYLYSSGETSNFQTIKHVYLHIYRELMRLFSGCSGNNNNKLKDLRDSIIRHAGVLPAISNAKKRKTAY